MASRFIPAKDSERIAFFKNFTAGIKEMGTQLGLTADEVNNVVNGTRETLERKDAVQLLFTNYQIAESERKTAEQAYTKLVVFAVNKMKNSGSWSEDTAKTLGVYMTPVKFDLTNIKPIPTLQVITGLIHVLFEKKGLTGVNIYGKINDDKDFVLLTSSTTSPYIDARPLRIPGVAEIRYYKLVGVKNDKEVGHASDIIWIAFAG